MTKEQKEAIEDLKREYEQCNYTQSDLIIELDYAKEILSLIKEQQEEIAKYEKIYKEYDCYRWVKELNKKDKQIDLMAKKINEAYCDETSFYNWFEKTFGIRAEGDYSKEIKQYFADLIEKE